MLYKSLGCLFLLFFTGAGLFCEEISWIELNQRMIQLFKNGQVQKACALGAPYVNQIQTSFQNNQMVSADAVVFLVNQGILCKQSGQYQEALTIIKLAADCKTKIASPNDPLFVSMYKSLSEICQSLKNFNDGEKYLLKAIEIKKINMGADHPETISLYLDLGTFYQSFGKEEKALESYEKALKISKGKNGEESNPTADVYFSIGKFHFNLKNYKKAEEAFLRSFGIYDKNKESKKIAFSYDYLGLLSQMKGNLQDAESYFRLSAKIKATNPGKNSLEYAKSLNNLGSLYNLQGKKEAEAILKESLSICEKKLGPNHPSLALTINNLIDFYSKNSNAAEVENYTNLLKKISAGR